MRIRYSKRSIHFLIALGFFVSLFLFLPQKSAHAQTDTFASSGTWTVPSGVSSAVFEAWGGGGAGGGATNSNTGGGGGAGGQYAKKTLAGLNVGDIYTVTVGGSAAGSTGNGNAGNDSGVVSPGSVQIVLAKGGAGGTANGAGGAGSTTGGVGDTVYAGGSGAATCTLCSGTGGGGGGGGAGSTGSGGAASLTTGGTGTSLNGGNGANGPTTKGGGAAGSNYGGGGSGGYKTNGGSQSGGAGAQGYVTVTYTLNSAPAAPTLITPLSGSTGMSATPQFTLRTTDADNDYLVYKIWLYQSDCSTAVGSSPFDESISQTGWSGQDADGGLAYTGSSTISGSTIATYTYQGTLSMNTTYCWKADAIDPAGSDTYSAVSPTQTFTTMSAPSTDQFLRGGEYFSGGSKQGYYWAQ